MGVTPGSERLPQEQREDEARRELFAVLAHELRSPIGAILGFEELLSEGILGEMPPSSADALTRIRGSARQLLDLVSGLNDLATDAVETTLGDPQHVDVDELLRSVIEIMESEASGRGAAVVLAEGSPLPALMTDEERVRRAVQLALMAAIKTTASGIVTVRTDADEHTATIRIEGSRLDTREDDPDISLHQEDRAHLTGAGLRIGMARRALAPLGGALHLQGEGGATTLILVLARAVPG